MSLNCSCFSGYFLKLFVIKNWIFCKLILFMSYRGQSCLKFIKVAVQNSLKLPFKIH